LGSSEEEVFNPFGLKFLVEYTEEKPMKSDEWSTQVNAESYEMVVKNLLKASPVKLAKTTDL